MGVERPFSNYNSILQQMNHFKDNSHHITADTSEIEGKVLKYSY